MCDVQTMIEMTSTKNTIVEDGISPTLTARMGTGGNQVNAVFSVQAIGEYKESEVCSALKMRDYKDATDLAIQPCFQNTGQGWWNKSDTAATIRTPCGGDAKNANVVIENIETYQQTTGALCASGYQKLGTQEAANDKHIVASVDIRNMCENQELSGTLQAKENGGQSLNYQNPVRLNSVVRRLTPTECERLQGFPDGWTDIGEWTDSKGKLHKESSDSARYKALGNSIAIPFWFYLLRRIAAQYERQATLGSLFDGIGGFPLAWERCNGKGTALFASEIEEFPIAVTKKHFPEE